MAVAVKICGLKTPEAVQAAVAGGARYVGFIFFSRSPRCVTLDDAARLAVAVPPGTDRVAVVVDADDRTLETILSRMPVEFLQCHGHETAERIEEIRHRFRIGVIKAVPVATTADLQAAEAYQDVADLLLFDSKAPAAADRPGGNALTFDWSLLGTRRWRRPWMLAGGINEENVLTAVRASGATALDISSGVEVAPGEKSIAKIRRFLAVTAEL